MATFDTEWFIEAHEKAIGIKPRKYHISVFRKLDQEEFDKIASVLVRTVMGEVVEDTEPEKIALDKLKADMKAKMDQKCCGWKEAIHLMMQADYNHSIDWWLYRKGVSYLSGQKIIKKYFENM